MKYRKFVWLSLVFWMLPTLVYAYCASRGNSQKYEYIQKVKIGSQEHSSGASPYSDFTSTVFYVIPEQQTSLTLTPGFPHGEAYKECWKVWIDYLHDSDFNDSGELIYSECSSSAITLNFVPKNYGGNARLRVSMKYNSSPSECEVFGYGEVEDYTIHINQTPVASFTMNKTSAKRGESVAVDSSGSYDPEGDLWIRAYTVTDSSGHIIKTEVGSANWSFTIPKTAALGPATVSLTVMDGAGLTSTMNRTLQILNNPPVASGTISPSTVYRNTGVIYFDASASSDYEDSDDQLSYTWKVMGYEQCQAEGCPEYSPATLHGKTAHWNVNNSHFLKYYARLTVTDRDGASRTYTTPMVSVVNQAPTVSQSNPSPSSLYRGQTLQLDCSPSDDSHIQSIHWWITKSTGETVYSHTISSSGLDYDASPTSESITIPSNWTPQLYYAKVQVTDNNSQHSSVAVKSFSVLNHPPTASLDPVPDIYRGQTLNLVAHASDQDGTVSSYAFWVEHGDGSVVTQTGYQSSNTWSWTAPSNLSPGSYRIVLRVQDNEGGYSSWVVKYFTIKNYQPVAHLAQPADEYRLHQITFHASPTDQDGTIVSYSWTLKKGSQTVASSTASTFSWIPPKTAELGQYTVYLTVTDNDGASSDQESKSFNILNNLPVAHANGPYSAQRLQTVSFSSAGSMDPETSVTGYDWKIFKNGTQVYSSTASMPNWTLPASLALGSYDVQLRVQDSDGGWSPVSHASLTVQNVPPHADAGGPYEAHAGHSVTISSGSSDPDGSIASCQWTVSYGGASQSFNTCSFDWTAPEDAGGRDYSLSLTVTDNDGGTASASGTIHVINDPPVADAGGPYHAYRTDNIVLDGSGSSDSDGSVTAFHWRILDGETVVASLSGDKPDLHIPSGWALKDYTVELTVQDNGGASNSTTTTLTVLNKPPQPQIALDDTVKRTETIVLDGSNSEDLDGSIASWIWTVHAQGQEYSFSGPVVNWTVPADAPIGNCTVELQVTDNIGNSTVAEDSFEILNNPPTVSIQNAPYHVYRTQSIVFEASAGDPDGVLESYEWALDCGHGPITFSEESPSWTPSANEALGNCTLSLTVVDSDGANATDSTTLEVMNALPHVELNPHYSVRQGESIEIVPLNEGDPDGNITDYSWILQEPGATMPITFRTDRTFTFSPSEGLTPKDYDLVLAVFDNDGGHYEVNSTLTVLPLNITLLPNGPYSAQRGTSIQFSSDGSQGPDDMAYSWTISNEGTQIAALIGPSPSWSVPTGLPLGTYLVTLEGRTQGGRIESANTTIEILDHPPALSLEGQYKVYSGTSATLGIPNVNDLDGTVNAYSWRILDESQEIFYASTAAPELSFSVPEIWTPKDYTLRVTAIDNDGENATAEAPLIVVGGGSLAVNAEKRVFSPHFYGDTSKALNVPVQVPDDEKISRIVLEDCHPAFYLMPESDCSVFGMSDLCADDSRDALNCGSSSGKRRYGCSGDTSTTDLSALKVFFDACFCEGEGLAHCTLKVYSNKGHVLYRKPLVGQCKGFDWLGDPTTDKDQSAFNVPSMVRRNKDGKFKIKYSCKGECQPGILGAEDFDVSTTCESTIKNAVCYYTLKPKTEEYAKEVEFSGPGESQTTLLLERDIVIDKDVKASPKIYPSGSGIVTFYSDKPFSVDSVHVYGSGVSASSSGGGGGFLGYGVSLSVSCQRPACLAYVGIHGSVGGRPFKSYVPVLTGSNFADIKPVYVSLSQRPKVSFGGSGLARLVVKNTWNTPIFVAGIRSHLPNETSILWTDLGGQLDPGETREIFIANPSPGFKFGTIVIRGCLAPESQCSIDDVKTISVVVVKEGSPDFCETSKKKEYQTSPSILVSKLGNKVDGLLARRFDQIFGQRNLIDLDYQNLYSILKEGKEAPDLGGMVTLITTGNLDDICK